MSEFKIRYKCRSCLANFYGDAYKDLNFTIDGQTFKLKESPEAMKTLVMAQSAQLWQIHVCNSETGQCGFGDAVGFFVQGANNETTV